MLVIWNKWRRFYFSSGPMKIKTKGEATVLSRIRDLIDERDMNADLFIACTMRAFTWGKLRPGFTNCLSKGEEYFERYQDDVRSDLDKSYYEESASA